MLSGVYAVLRSRESKRCLHAKSRTMALRSHSGQSLGCDAAMCYAEMTRHRIAIGILQPLGMRVCDCDSAQMQDLHFSVLLQGDLAG